jgi:hypothetical protein
LHERNYCSYQQYSPTQRVVTQLWRHIAMKGIGLVVVLFKIVEQIIKLVQSQTQHSGIFTDMSIVFFSQNRLKSSIE